MQLTPEFVPSLMVGPDFTDVLVERPDDAGGLSRFRGVQAR
jgi:hypothetical protein